MAHQSRVGGVNVEQIAVLYKEHVVQKYILRRTNINRNALIYSCSNYSFNL